MIKKARAADPDLVKNIEDAVDAMVIPDGHVYTRGKLKNYVLIKYPPGMTKEMTARIEKQVSVAAHHQCVMTCLNA